MKDNVENLFQMSLDCMDDAQILFENEDLKVQQTVLITLILTRLEHC
jgi:hypothetical protein